MYFGYLYTILLISNHLLMNTYIDFTMLKQTIVMIQVYKIRNYFNLKHRNLYT